MKHLGNISKINVAEAVRVSRYRIGGDASC